MFERVIYVSRATPGVDAGSVYDIIRVSHNRNSRFGLTGALIFLDGYFLQVLEGDGFQVRDRFSVIAADPRHTDVVLRQSARMPHLTFATEWMALRQGVDILQATKQAFGYAPGFPADRFDADKLAAFTLACCTAYGERTDGAQAAR